MIYGLNSIYATNVIIFFFQLKRKNRLSWLYDSCYLINNSMQAKELIAKTITDVYGIIVYEQYGMDTADIFVGLEDGIFIEIPGDPNMVVYEKELPDAAVVIIPAMTDEAADRKYTANTQPVASSITPQKTFWHRLRSIFLPFDQPPLLPAAPPRIGPNPPVTMRYIKNRRIADFIWYPGNTHNNGFLLLDNGCVIGHTAAAMSGTGLAGLNYFNSLETFEQKKGTGYRRLLQL